MRRLFSFGCSFTQYHWPTWADILARDFDYFENWGHSGGGNQFIFSSLNECVMKKSITQDDLVAIMWTNVAREDRYVNNKWLFAGGIYNQIIYSEDFVKNFSDPIGYLIRDLALIHSAKKMLEFYKIPHVFVSMVPIYNIDQYHFNSPLKNAHSIFMHYKSTITSIRPSVFETVFEYNWRSKPKKHPEKTDLHPLPVYHLEYVDKTLKEYTVSDQTRHWVDTITDRLIHGQDYSDLWIESTNLPDRW